LNDTQTHPPAPIAVRQLFAAWHRLECGIAMAALAAIALLLIVDVAGRELLAPLLRRWGLDVGSGGIFGAQKMAVYLMVLVAYCGIGIAVVSGAHLVPRLGFAWLPARWAPRVARIGDAFSGIVLLVAGAYALELVDATLRTGVRMPSLGGLLWPLQLMVPLGLWSAALRYLGYAFWPGLRSPTPLATA
jgi:hypothetical protein